MFTCPHFTAFQVVNIVKPIFVVIAIYSSNIVTNLLTCGPSLFIKLVSDEFVVTMLVRLWMAYWFTTFSFFYVMQIIPRCTIQTIEKISLRTNTPSTRSKEEILKKIFRGVRVNAFYPLHRRVGLFKLNTLSKNGVVIL